MILVAVAMIAIIAMAALSIDVVTLYLARMETQRSADAGALAAARVISLSGITGDPNNVTGLWAAVCGGTASPASQAATAAVNQNLIGGVAPSLVVVNYHDAGTTSPDCSRFRPAFGVNPLVTVIVTRNNLPTFFSRIWGNAGNTVNAYAVAEAFNSSNSGNEGFAPDGTIIPVQPRCVKPWFIPNLDPLNPINPPGPCTDKNSCSPFVDQGTGQIINPGVSSVNGGVIGETFWLSPDCHHLGANCNPRTTPPPPPSKYANWNMNAPYVQGPPNLLYLPGEAPSSVVAVPSCSSGGRLYEQAIGGCDQQTVYQCGVQNMNTVDLSENPGPGTNDTMNGVSCLINEGDPAGGQPDGQDTINTSPTSPPSLQILAGSSNPLVAQTTPITASPSIVSVPIFDYNNPIGNTGTSTVTVVGFLQVFINAVDQYGSMNVTVLNVTGCSNGAGGNVGTALTGSSPVPVRLVTNP